VRDNNHYLDTAVNTFTSASLVVHSVDETKVIHDGDSGFGWIWLLLLVLLTVGVGGTFAYFYLKKQHSVPTELVEMLLTGVCFLFVKVNVYSFVIFLSKI
jgi:hypothetical protein